VLDLLKKVMGRGEIVVPTQPLQAALPVRPEPDDEIPRYPPFVKGLPASHPDRLIQTQQELIGQIRESGLASKETFENFYLEPLRRFAAYAHLLPASESHHHRGAGGLFRHAIEVGLLITAIAATSPNRVHSLMRFSRTISMGVWPEAVVAEEKIPEIGTANKRDRRILLPAPSEVQVIDATEFIASCKLMESAYR